MMSLLPRPLSFARAQTLQRMLLYQEGLHIRFNSASCFIVVCTLDRRTLCYAVSIETRWVLSIFTVNLIAKLITLRGIHQLSRAAEYEAGYIYLSSSLGPLLQAPATQQRVRLSWDRTRKLKSCGLRFKMPPASEGFL